MRLRLSVSLVVVAVALSIGCSDTPVAPSPDDPQALLTDAQLVTVADPAAPTVDPAWDEWIKKNHYTIRSLTSTRDDDLQFLKKVIGSRRLVQLGESGHGVREFNLAKVRLIRFLHEEMGFDVIAFESGLFECWKANQLASEATHLFLGRCIYGVWSTEEVFELFEYIRETRSTSRPLILAGVDVQMSNTATVRQFAPALLAEVVGRIDPAYASRVSQMEETFYSEFSAAASSAPFDLAVRAQNIAAVDDKMKYSARYDSLRTFIDANASALATAYAASPEIPLVARQTAFARSQTILQGRNNSAVAASTIRDRGMADNVDFLLDRLYPGKKVMLWAHNAHIMHDHQASTFLTSPSPLPQSMGAFISARRRSDLYTIGLFMYRGEAANNGGARYTIRPALPGSLEAVMYRTRKQWTFVDMLNQTRTAGTSWMFDAIPAKEWGTWDYRFSPRAQFDGILFIDTVNPPKYYTYVPPRGF